MTKKRFINDINNEKLIDTKEELSTIHYSDAVDFYELWEFLNKLNDENEQLKQPNKELLLLVDTLKEQNMKFKTRLNDLGVEYYD